MLGRVLRAAARWSNPVTRWMLAGPLHVVMSRRLLLVAFTGRKTGRSYMTPVSYVIDGDRLLVPGGGAWWKNLGTEPVSVRLRGTWLSTTPEVIREPRAVSETLGRMMAANPALSIFTGISREADGRPSSASLERELRRGFVVVQLQLEDQVTAEPTMGRRSAA